MDIFNNFNLDPNAIAAHIQYGFAQIGSLLTTVAIPSIVWGILQIIASWMVFKKAGEPGWKCLIPIYNAYIMYKIADKKHYFWIMLLISILAGALTVIINILAFLALPAAVLAIVLMIIAIVLNIIVYYNLSVNFGHGAGFALGLIFLGPIFMMILAFGSSVYKGQHNR